jgi:hypothetical protein
MTMSRLSKVACACGFWGLLLFAAVPPLAVSVQPAAQELPIPPVLPLPSTIPAQPSKGPWYTNAALTALAGALAGAVVGAIATTCAAFMTGLINLRVRKITNAHELQLRELVRQHELQKLSVQKQLEVCGSFAEQIVKFILITPGDSAVGVFDGLIELIAAFERSYPFLDKHTTKTFDEFISIPFKNKELVRIYEEKGAQALFDEVRRRLMTNVLPTLRTFLDSIK